jgi:hypothetical protein
MVQYEALAWTTGGLGFFVLVGYAAAWWDKRRQCPWVCALFNNLINVLHDFLYFP